MSGSNKEKIPPLSIRLTQEERERLLNAAGSMTIAAYVRMKVFDGEKPSRYRKAYTRKKNSPSSELTMIGHMLGGLGASEVARNLDELAGAAKIGALPVSPEIEEQILQSCAAVQDMSRVLISALGVKVR